jgi:hypothetical protein
LVVLYATAAMLSVPPSRLRSTYGSRDSEVTVATAARQKITTFLMFEGHAEDAMTFYVSLFDDGEIGSVTRYGAGEAGGRRVGSHRPLLTVDFVTASPYPAEDAFPDSAR